MMEAFIYGDNHIKITEKCFNHPHIKALKNDNQLFVANIDDKALVFTQ
jgi:hypothetical protein